MGPSRHLWFLDAKQWLLDKNNKSLLVPDITYRFKHENSVIGTWNTNLYGSQPSSVVNAPSSVVFACKAATFGPE